jgi:hypothetical protein
MSDNKEKGSDIIFTEIYAKQNTENRKKIEKKNIDIISIVSYLISFFLFLYTSNIINKYYIFYIFAFISFVSIFITKYDNDNVINPYYNIVVMIIFSLFMLFVFGYFVREVSKHLDFHIYPHFFDWMMLILLLMPVIAFFALYAIDKKEQDDELVTEKEYNTSGAIQTSDITNSETGETIEANSTLNTAIKDENNAFKLQKTLSTFAIFSAIIFILFGTIVSYYFYNNTGESFTLIRTIYIGVIIVISLISLFTGSFVLMDKIKKDGEYVIKQNIKTSINLIIGLIFSFFFLIYVIIVSYFHISYDGKYNLIINMILYCAILSLFIITTLKNVQIL